MADIDVSELLSDPDFIDPLGLVRRTIALVAGAAVVSEEPAVTIYGSVQPASADDLVILPSGTRLADTLSLWTLTPLTAQAADGAGDVLVWQGRRWVVRAREAFGHFGAGYNKVLAVAEAVHAE